MTSTLPRMPPMQPKPLPRPFTRAGWTFDLKYEGYRGLLYVEPGSARFRSKLDKPLQRSDELARAIAKELKVSSVILDGEVFRFDEDGRMTLSALASRGPEAYVAFDILWLNGEDLRARPLAERRRLLRRVIPGRSSLAFLGVTRKRQGTHFFELVCKQNLEGIVAKKLSDPYGGRSVWYKIKNPTYTEKGSGRALFGIRKRKKKRGG